MDYDTLVERVGQHLGVDPTRIRLWMMNFRTGGPPTEVRRKFHDTLHKILVASGYGEVGSLQGSCALYFEVLDDSPAELSALKMLKIG